MNQAGKCGLRQLRQYMICQQLPIACQVGRRYRLGRIMTDQALFAEILRFFGVLTRGLAVWHSLGVTLSHFVFLSSHLASSWGLKKLTGLMMEISDQPVPSNCYAVPRNFDNSSFSGKANSIEVGGRSFHSSGPGYSLLPHCKSGFLWHCQDRTRQPA